MLVCRRCNEEIEALVGKRVYSYTCFDDKRSCECCGKPGPCAGVHSGESVLAQVEWFPSSRSFV